MDVLVKKIQENIERYPDFRIINDSGEDNFFTYRTFSDYAQKVAGKLQRMGVGAKDFVTIELPRNKEYIACMYAVWLTGGAFAPLSVTYPKERIAYIRNNCQAKAVIDSDFLRDIENEEKICPNCIPNADDPSLMIYTSGSTGKPKGVLHSHRSIRDSIVRYAEYIADFPCKRVALGSPFTFVASVQGIFVPLYDCTSTYLMPYEAMRDPVLLADFIEQYQIERTFISPKMLKVFQPKGTSLKVVTTGSERVSNIYRKDFTIKVCYGQTESASAVLAFTVDRKYDNTPIGKPLGNIRTYILDENGKEAVEGELCLAGYFADGYFHLPELTAKTFIANPFKERDGFSTLLRTGDIVRQNENGDIVYLNRKDWMVKINGQRVEPGEIETVIKNTDGVFDAVIKDFKNQYGQTYLVAYYVEKQPLDSETIRKSVQNQLPDYMIPSFFVRLDKLPVNANGKLDRNALTPPEIATYKSEYVAPETDWQKILCQAYGKILGVENVGIDDDFFALGGDSIKSAMVVTECQLNILKSADILSAKTPRNIERILLNRETSQKTVVPKTHKPKIYPLTSSERGMYLEQKLDENSTVYNLNISAVISGTDTQTVKNALTAVMQSHEAFCSRYAQQDGIPVRIVTDTVPEIVVETLQSVQNARTRIDNYSTPFNLDDGIPVRPALYEISDGTVVLHMAIHHIAFDGTSAGIFYRELFNALQGKTLPCNETDLSDIYDINLSEQYQDSMHFYKTMFADGIPVNEMPIKGTRPKIHPTADRQTEFMINNTVLLDRTARKFMLSEFELLFSALAMTLGKYTASDDVVLGIPVNMRPNGAENIIGMFVNTAPVRVKVDRNMALGAYLEQTGNAVRQSSYGMSLPFEMLVREFVKENDPSRNAVFDVSVNYMASPSVMENNGISLTPYAPLQKMTRDIGMVIRKNEKGLRVICQYSSELFEDKVIGNFMEQFRNTLRLMADDNTKTVRDAMAMPENQADELEKYSVSAKSDIPVMLLHKLFEHIVKENPEHMALIASDGSYTYRQLNEKANIVAHHLIAKGVKKGDTVCLLLPRTSVFFACLFGVNKAGACFIPCDPEYPADRINHIIEDSQSTFIITTKDKLSDYSSQKAIDVEKILFGDNTDNPAVDVSPEDLAYMIYTSGSTGKPKGVMLAHKGICNYLYPHEANLHIRQIKDSINTYISVTTVSFDMSFKEHTATLCNGKTLVFADEEQMNDPVLLSQLMQQYHVDCINATPSRLSQYMEYPPFCEALSCCQLIMSGGEGYPLSLRDRIKAVAPNARIVNTYGPTEITVSSNGCDITNAPYITVGKPLLNYKEYIVDKFGDITSYGVMGELYIGGAGVAKGYKNLEQMTAERFVRFHKETFYRSGDYAKWDSDGNVMIFGRLDSQVKLRGLRIELGEIEGLIEQYADIKKAVVIIRKINGQDNLCAYFTAESTIDTSRLKDELRQHLTYYMIPSALVQLDEIPVTPNGKTDVRALPEPELLPQTVTPAQNETQQKILAVVSEVISGGNIGIETDLYEAGLTSLNSVKLSIVLSETFGVNIRIRDFREHSTIEKLEQFIIQNRNETNEFPVLDDYDITTVQQGIFVETLAHPDTTLYNIPTLIVLDDSTDIEKLKSAICTVIEAHPYMKTKLFFNDKGELRQKRDTIPFTVNDIETITCYRIEDIKDSLLQPFTLTKERLFRVKIITDNTKNYLLLDIHHIIFDGVSKNIFLRDISRAYAGEEVKAEQFSGFESVLAEESLRKSDFYEKSKAYYTALFDGVEIDSLPTGDIIDKEVIAGSDSILTVGTHSNNSAVEKFCQENHISENAFFTAVMGYILGKYCYKEETVFTSVYNGRNDPRFSESISMFVKTYPVLCRTENKTVKAYIAEVGSQLVDSMHFDAYSFAEISRDLQINADMLFVWQGAIKSDPVFCGSPLNTISLELNEAKAKIELMVYPDGDRLKYHCTFRTDCYSRQFMERLISVYDKAVTEFIVRENICDIDVVDEEQSALLDSFNANEKDYEYTDIVTLFRRQAEKNPENTCVVHLDKVYTYGEVDAVTEKIGGYLKSSGIGREDVVSVLIPRCEYMVIASVGILKSGAGYQPLDPSYPTERLEFMIQDSQAKLLIADRNLKDRMPDYTGKILYTDEIPTLPECEKITENPCPEDLFIMLYTSGSTGVPKGVMLEHHNLVAFSAWYRERYELTEKSVVAAYASYGFDACMMDIYPALTTGATVHIIDDSIRLDLPQIKKYFDTHKITHSFMTTQVGRQFAMYYNCNTLQHFSVGGEKLVPINPDNICTFHNIYGPTECTICITDFVVDKLYERVPIGKCCDNLKMYIVDKNGRRLPPDIPGELWVAGHRVGRGYLNRPEKNAETFIRNPFSQQKGYERVYRTGDIVRYRSDGNIDFIGRNDGQVKIRGFRIELTEVESIIRAFDGIKDATVQAFDDENNGGKFIAAYIVADEKIDITALNQFILAEKPPYMVPAVTMQIDQIPLNQNQKVNKKALPKPVFEQSDTAEEETSRPKTRFEEEIAEIVGEVIGNENIRVSASLIHYGLTSIHSIRLASMLDSKFHVEIPVSRLISGASIVDIENIIFEKWLSQGFNATDTSKPVSVAASQTDKYYPLSSVQLAVYFDAMKRQGDILYNIPFCFAFEHIDISRLTQAIKDTVKAHSYLNARFEIHNGALVQIPDREAVVEIPCYEIADSEFENYRSRFIRPFELHKNEPLYRFAIVRTTTKVYLFMDIHHIIFDGLSTGIFMKDLGRAYSGETLSDELYSGFDYAKEEQSLKETSAYKEAEEYYDKLLSKMETVSEIPPDKNGNMENGASGEAFCMISRQTVDKFCKAHSVTPSTLFLSAVFYAVSRFANTKNVCISTIANGRESVRLHNSVGMYVHTIPLAMNFDEEMSALALIDKSNTVMHQSIAHQIYPFTEIASKYGYSTNIMYECQTGVISGKNEIGDCPFVTVPMKLDTPKFKTALAVYDKDGEYAIAVRYNDALYTQDYMQTLANAIKVCAETMMNDENISVRHISLLDDTAKEQIQSFRAVATCDIPEKLLHKMFETAVRQNPDKTALIAVDDTLTYTRLNAQANIIAHNLMARGVNRGDSIVLLLPRKSFYFSALFGVLKTGACFIPCDPAYPADRINHIITDAEASYIITTQEKLGDYPAEKALDIYALLSGNATENPDREVSPEDLAYMIYTSGSTGKPKGVMLRHEGICNYIFPHEANPHMKLLKDTIDIYLSITTVSFDMSFKEHTATLCNGKTLLFAGDDQMNNPMELTRLLNDYGVDCINATPSRLTQYMEYQPFCQALTNCKLIMSGGENYPLSLRDKIRKSAPDAQIINTYGPTEITVSSNVCDITHAEYISVGRPLLNYSEYIVDCDGNPVPCGVTGELYIGGVGVAKGYKNLDDMTKTRFIEYNDERIYKSGDYAKWDKYGNVIILGRMDSQVKLRGLRIELGEIEGIIEQQPYIKKAVVVIRKINGQDNLCAYFTAEKVIDIDTLKEELKQHLTHYMIPSAFLQLEKFPVTPNGKTDVRALPEPVVSENNDYIPPSNETEAYFCNLFAEILHIDKVGIHDSFFEIGGTSLVVTSVVISASEKGYAVSYSDVFKYATPKALARLVTGTAEEEPTLSATDFSKYDYTAINNLLAENTLTAYQNGTMREIGNILLTGATGYMGAHLLSQFLQKETGTAYCMVRKGQFETAEQRLRNLLYYYFEDRYEKDIGTRVIVLDGDVTDYRYFEPFEQFAIHTVFNCAANVKHFSSGTDIEDINVGGVRNCIAFCQKTNTRLIHFSTTSVAGAFAQQAKNKSHTLNEQSMYFGQLLDNQYISSKMLAEREVMQAIVEKGLDGKVIRVGTLAARESDGEFQINFLTNSFMGRLRSYRLLKCFPYSMINTLLRMGPIDKSAEAFLLLAKTPTKCCLFNAVNNHTVPLGYVINMMNRDGMNIRFVEHREFVDALSDAEKDPQKAAILSSMLAYKNMNGGTSAVPVAVRSDYTTQILARMGFFWNPTDEKYIRQFIEALVQLGFFDETNLNR